MRRGRFIFLGFSAIAGAGCAIVAGLGDYEVTDPPPDGGTDAVVEAAPVIDATPDRAPVVVVDAGPCVACPSGTPRMLCIDNACVETRRVFVTQASYSANLGGVAGADLQCQTSATVAKLGGTWKSWTSAAASPAGERLAIAATSYRLDDGTLVAASGDAFRSPEVDASVVRIAHVIDRDENGALVEAKEVWTGTRADGGTSSVTCKDWTSESKEDTARVGVTTANNAEWTTIYPQFCDRTDPHLYCFEQ